ncbi:MAG: hypothetical protein MJ202_01010 [Lentisphaeria bacterium]|nr:hypothetical protein [Lentisphaeria bacterium]
MPFVSQTFQQQVASAAEALKTSLRGRQAPAYYLHFAGQYLLPGLFDDTPETIPLAQLSSEASSMPNLDGQEPAVLLGCCDKVPVMVATGIRRTVEGCGMLEALFPTVLAEQVGVRNHIFLDTAISLQSEWKAGQWGMLSDFINGYAVSPLEGLQGMLEHSFPNLSEVFSQVQNSEIINALAAVGDAPKLCTYYGVPGFHLPSMAEARMIREQGADFLGHDLVLHVILSYAMGCRVSALALAGGQILPGMSPHFTRQELTETEHFCSRQLCQGLRTAIRSLHDSAEGYVENVLPDADADELIRASIQRSATRSSPLKAFLRK